MYTKKIVFIVAFCIVASGGIFVQQTGSPDTKLPPKYEKWLDEEVTYIISPKEKDVFLKLKTDGERDIFIESFWKQRDPNPATPENEFKDEHYRRLAYVNSKYGTSSLPGWKTEAGRNYIVLGDLKFIGWNMKMRIFEGIKEGAVEPVKAVTSSYLQYRITASIRTEFDLAEEQKQIRKTFNLKDARLLTEADFNWEKGNRERTFHIFRLDGKEYLL
jgi:GWxTD domain-containing protein